MAGLNISLWVFVHLYTKKSTAGRSSTSRDKKLALVTTCSISALFIITWSPTVIRFIMGAWPTGTPTVDGAPAAYIPAWLEKIRIIYIFGSWGNPVIYTMINARFRTFVVNQMRRMLPCWPGNKSNTCRTVVKQVASSNSTFESETVTSPAVPGVHAAPARAHVKVAPLPSPRI